MTTRSLPAAISDTLVHGFRVLQAFQAARPALTLGQVAERAGLDQQTAFHFVQTLVVLGYVERIAGSKQFRLTLKPLELGFNALMHNLEAHRLTPAVDNGSANLNICSLSELDANDPSHSEESPKPR
jgi:IclR family transcriptional regulator, pca regulon regulatory protein